MIEIVTGQETDVHTPPKSPEAGTELVRTRIVGAAEQCFLDYGVKRTTLDDIASRLGIARPTIYRYFSDRDALIVEVVTRRAHAYSARARAFIEALPTFQDKLVDGIVFSIAGGRRDRILQVLLSPDNLNAASELLTNANASHDLTYEIWASTLEAAQNAGEMHRDLDVRQVCGWIADIELMIIGRLDLFDDEFPSPREMVAEFLLPALLPHH